MIQLSAARFPVSNVRGRCCYSTPAGCSRYLPTTISSPRYPTLPYHIYTMFLPLLPSPSQSTFSSQVSSLKCTGEVLLLNPSRLFQVPPSHHIFSQVSYPTLSHLYQVFTLIYTTITKPK